MEDKTLLEKLLSQLDEDKRQEAYDKLSAAETLDEMKAIVQEFDINLAKPEAMLSLVREQGYELSDEELEQVAGGRPDWLPTPNTSCYTCSCN